jgi:CRISPR/Cas system-associated endonuclease Cas1
VRDQTASDATERLEKTAVRIDMKLRTLQSNLDVDQLRGVEGDASADYFGVFNDLITPHAGRGLKHVFRFGNVTTSRLSPRTRGAD